jgi:hypothetical protein
MLNMKFSLALVLCLGSSWVHGEEEAMSAVDLTEDNFKDKVCKALAGTCVE